MKVFCKQKIEDLGDSTQHGVYAASFTLLGNRRICPTGKCQYTPQNVTPPALGADRR